MSKEEKESGVRMYSVRLLIATSLEKEELAEAVETWADNRFKAYQEPSIVAVDELLATATEGVFMALQKAHEALGCVHTMAHQMERLTTVIEKTMDVESIKPTERET